MPEFKFDTCEWCDSNGVKITKRTDDVGLRYNVCCYCAKAKTPMTTSDISMSRMFNVLESKIEKNWNAMVDALNQ